MLLHRLHLNLRSREARRDLSNPYQMHATLSRAFSSPEARCQPGSFLWRLEPQTPSGAGQAPQLLVQSHIQPHWIELLPRQWLAKSPDQGLDLRQKLSLAELSAGRRFRFRLRANPCVTRQGKRCGLLKTEEQEAWLSRQGQACGFELPAIANKGQGIAQQRFRILISQEHLIKTRKHKDLNHWIQVFSVLYDGQLIVTNPVLFSQALERGIGHGKALGLGLLSVAALRDY